jgi:VanZ family protein
MKQNVRERPGGAIRKPGPRWLRILLLVLLVLNMAVIFGFSARTSAESTKTSDAVLAKPKEVYDAIHPETAGDYKVYWWFQFIVRKGAHVLEFASLSVWATGLLLAYAVRFAYPLGGCFAAVYAASDELHQLFVPGRDGKVTDWLFDCLGAVLGVLAVALFMHILRKRKKGG